MANNQYVVNALSNMTGKVSYSDIKLQLEKECQKKRLYPEKVVPLLEKLFAINIDLSVIPSLLWFLNSDDPLILRLTYFILSSLAPKFNEREKYANEISKRFKDDMTIGDGYRTTLSLRAFAGYKYSMAGKPLILDHVRSLTSNPLSNNASNIFICDTALFQLRSSLKSYVASSMLQYFVEAACFPENPPAHGNSSAPPQSEDISSHIPSNGLSLLHTLIINKNKDIKSLSEVIVPLLQASVTSQASRKFNLTTERSRHVLGQMCSLLYQNISSNPTTSTSSSPTKSPSGSNPHSSSHLLMGEMVSSYVMNYLHTMLVDSSPHVQFTGISSIIKSLLPHTAPLFIPLSASQSSSSTFSNQPKISPEDWVLLSSQPFEPLISKSSQDEQDDKKEEEKKPAKPEKVDKDKKQPSQLTLLQVIIKILKTRLKKVNNNNTNTNELPTIHLICRQLYVLARLHNAYWQHQQQHQKQQQQQHLQTTSNLYWSLEPLLINILQKTTNASIRVAISRVFIWYYKTDQLHQQRDEKSKTKVTNTNYLDDGVGIAPPTFVSTLLKQYMSLPSNLANELVEELYLRVRTSSNIGSSSGCMILDSTLSLLASIFQLKPSRIKPNHLLQLWLSLLIKSNKLQQQQQAQLLTSLQVQHEDLGPPHIIEKVIESAFAFLDISPSSSASWSTSSLHGSTTMGQSPQNQPNNPTPLSSAIHAQSNLSNAPTTNISTTALAAATNSAVPVNSSMHKKKTHRNKNKLNNYHHQQDLHQTIYWFLGFLFPIINPTTNTTITGLQTAILMRLEQGVLLGTWESRTVCVTVLGNIGLHSPSYEVKLRIYQFLTVNTRVVGSKGIVEQILDKLDKDFETLCASVGVSGD